MVITGRKWAPDKSIQEAESRLRHEDIVESVPLGRQGLGVISKPRWRTARQRAKRELIQKELRDMEEARIVKAMGMKKQGSWLNWQGEVCV